MISFSPCKINIGLNIINKRIDGYHNLETLFYPVYFIKDIVEVVPASNDKDSYGFSGIPISSELNDNLCVKTINLLRKHYKFPNIELYLHKNVPMGAGLGGGSANVATIINLIDKLFNFKMSLSEKIHLSGSLGSDCAFFIEAKPSIGYEKGNVLSPVDISLAGYSLIIVKPNIHVSTAEAYSTVVPSESEKKLPDIINKPIESWKNQIHNDFEKSVFVKFPEIERIKDKLYQKGALYAQMSGSGSAVFGIFNEVPDIEWDKGYLVYSGKLT